MWQLKVFTILHHHQSSFFVIKRFCHFKFNKAKFNKQSSIMGKFDLEIRDTMERIKQKQKVRTKRNKTLLSETTNVFLKMNTGDYKPEMDGCNYASGLPEQLMLTKEGVNHKFLTTKMKVMNSNYSRAIAEIFATNDEFTEKMDEYKIRITQARITTNLRILHIYWVTDREDIDEQFVNGYLNSLKGKIYELLGEFQHASVLPWISFINDLEESNSREIALRLKKCKDDLEKWEKLNSEDAVNLNTNVNEFKLSDKISFEDPIEEIPIDEMYERMVRCNLKENNDRYRLRMPQDMPLNIFNLDYEHLMNRVLQTMNRSRAQQRLASPFSLGYALGEHLPPLDNVGNNDAPAVDYNTEERIKAIKRFVNINKKNRNKAALKLKRMILQEEIDRHETYEDLKEAMELRLEETFKDSAEDEFVEELIE